MPKENLVIIGSGGLAREIRWLIEECNKLQDVWNIVGWISKEKEGSIIDGLPVLGDDDYLLNYDEPICAVVSVGDGKLRKKIVTYLRQNKNISFPTILSPSAELSDTVSLGEGSIIAAKSILTVNIEIGAFFLCNLCCTIGHDCKFKDFVTLNPGVNISGKVNLGDNVTMGTGAAVIQEISIGDNVMVGAGAVVVRDVPEGLTVVGIPAKPMKSI